MVLMAVVDINIFWKTIVVEGFDLLFKTGIFKRHFLKVLAWY